MTIYILWRWSGKQWFPSEVSVNLAYLRGRIKLDFSPQLILEATVTPPIGGPE